MENDTKELNILYYILEIEKRDIIAITHEYPDMIKGYNIDTNKVFFKPKRAVVKLIQSGKYDVTKYPNL